MALFSGLAPNTQYTYAVTSSAAARPVTYSFTNAPSDRPPIFAVYADFGFGNDVSLSALVKDAAQNGFDYVIHSGDWAYDMDSSNSQVGNSFMNSVQPYAAVKPYMYVPHRHPPPSARPLRLDAHPPSPPPPPLFPFFSLHRGTVGNHEAYGTQGGGAFANYAQRQRALREFAGAACGSNSSFWYSFDTPLVHWVAFSGESWTMSAAQLAAQDAWLRADLARVDRAATPWVLAFSHKAYMMDSTTWAMYDFLAELGVDVQFVGHWHQYTRYPPIDSRGGKVAIDAASVSADKRVYTNPRYPVVLVAGAPGDGEVNPKGCTEPNAVYCSGNYGYGWAQAVNATHFHWKWNTTVPVAGSPDPGFSDELWIVKS